MRSWIAFFLVGALSFAARADERTSAAREHYYKGTSAFDLGQYDVAITEYMAAYGAKNDPALLYNIAQAHRLAGHTREALRFYKVYLARMSVAPNRVEVEAKIIELQKAVDQESKTQHELPPDQVIKPQTPANGETKPEPRPQPQPQPVVEPTPPAPTPEPVAVTESPAPRPGRTKKLAGIGVGVAGLALVAVGGAFAGLAASDSNQVSQTAKYDPSLYSQGQTYQLLEGVFLGVGAAAVVTGIVLYALGHRESKRASVGASLSGRGAQVHFSF